MAQVELTSTTLPGYVEQTAPKYGLDPAAVLAVASQEGLGGGIGDQGTSFGPWQLHAGGALPPSEYGGPGSQKTQQWAWSTGGVDYALAQMSAAASGKSGLAAIEAIVSGFERPANPAKEIQGAAAQYGTFSGGGSAGTNGPSAPAASSSSGAQDVSLTSSIGGVAVDGLLRVMFVLGAIVLAGIALYLLARAFGERAPVPAAIGDLAERVTPTGRAVQAASRKSRVASAGAGAARERRAEEAHQERVKVTRARATEVRSRSRRAATSARKQREQDFNRGYVERATEEASPNLSRARRQNRNEE